MRNMILVLTLEPEEQALWDGRHAMVVALNDAEAAVLRGNVLGVADFLAFNLKCLSTLRQVLESTGDKEAAIARTLHMLMEPARVAVDLQGQVRETLGRAAFVGPASGKGRVQ